MGAPLSLRRSNVQALPRPCPRWQIAQGLQQIKANDERLNTQIVGLSRGVDRLLAIARDQAGEVAAQGALVDGLRDGVDRAAGRLDANSARMQRILRR